MGNFLQKINPNWDPDILFGYDTVREVKVRDRRLGFVYYFFLMAIVFYIVIWVFMIKKQYLAAEKTTGWTLNRLMYHQGTTVSEKVFDVFESLTNDGEQGAIFIPTRVVTTTGQSQEVDNPTKGFCESPLHTCTAPEDCDIGDDDLQKAEECVNGRCMRRQWCPAMEIDTPATKTDYVNTNNFDIWFSTNIHFHLFALDVGNTDEKKSIRYPDRGANTFAVHDLLRLAGIDIEKVKDTGMILNVNKVFNCDLDQNICVMNVESSAIVQDSGDGVVQQGFNYAHQDFYMEDGVQKRILTRYYGIRIYVSATGIGKKSSFANIVLQISSAIALLSCAVAAADVFLQSIVPERKHYIELKIIDTEDFNKLNP